MVGREEGRRGNGIPRGSTRGRRGGGYRGSAAPRSISRGEIVAVRSKEAVNDRVSVPERVAELVDNNLDTDYHDEHSQVAGTSLESRLRHSRTSRSSDRQGLRDDVLPARENLDAVNDGCDRVEDNVEEVGVKGLSGLAASTSTCQLSESELENNKQQQEDEVLALQAIYGIDYVSVAEDGAGLTAFMIHVDVEIEDSMKIVADAPWSLESKNERNGAVASTSEPLVENQHTFTVKALPPITLLCALPPTYPSHSAPLYKLRCLWLNSKKLSNLCACLDKVWEDTSPEVVVYLWSDWLRSQALPHLGCKGVLELGPYYRKRSGKSIGEGLDNRALSASVSFDVDIPLLLRYNEEVKNKEFLETLHTCYICFSELPGYSFTRMPCQHIFCKSCMRQYCNMHVKEGSVMNLKCPDTSCKESIPPGLLKELLGKEGFERWEDLLLQKTLDSMSDVIYCPRCGTPNIEDQDHFVQCSKCRFSFCSLCTSAWHVGQTCMTAEAKLRILQGRQQGRAMGEEALRKEKELINEVMSMTYINKETKPCPTCKMAVSKSEGCNKMTCTNCGSYFCFKCGRAISGYEHYRDASSCVLFDQEEIDRWEVQFNLQQLQLQQQQQAPNRVGALAAIRPCPNCRQPNLKEGNNNHMFCWACQNHYCALCNKLVRRSAEHFGNNKCKQHTAD